MQERGIPDRRKIGKIWSDHHLTKIIFLRTDDWVRVIALVSMIQSGSFIVGAGAVLVGRLFGYDVLPTDSSIFYLLIGMTVGIGGLFLGMYLYDGVEEKNPNKLLAWIFYAGFVLSLLFVDLCVYFGYYSADENWKNIFGICLCFLIYSICIVFVNIHRLELIAIVNNRQTKYRHPSREPPSSAENSANYPPNQKSKENDHTSKGKDDMEIEIKSLDNAVD